jgi:cytochrome P450
MALYLKDKLAEARARAKEMGPEVSAEMANNTLDMMVARELKGEDWMSDDEMRDELYLCE